MWGMAVFTISSSRTSISWAMRVMNLNPLELGRAWWRRHVTGKDGPGPGKVTRGPPIRRRHYRRTRLVLSGAARASALRGYRKE